MKKQQATPPTPTPTTPAPTLMAATHPQGMIHVRVLRARNLPTMDFGKRQDPYVLVQLEDATPTVSGTTDPAFQGGTDPEWSEDDNREIELFYERKRADQDQEDVVLTLDVFANESGEDLIGTGKVNVGKIVHDQTAVPTEFTIRLKDAANGAANRGELVVQVWFGPPVRKAFRFAQRASALLGVRDSVLHTVLSAMSTAAAPVSKALQGPVDYLKKNRKLGIAALAAMGIAVATSTTLFLMIATPIAIVALLTFPFWIIPFLAVAFFTAPLWIPVLVLVGLFLTFVTMVILGLGITSRPVRRQGAKLSARLRETDVGKRVLYEKTA